MSEWQPIETAPTDGTPMLIWLAKPYDQQVYNGPVPVTQIVIGDLSPDHDGLIVSPDGAWIQATHWQPLPEGPGHKQDRLKNIAEATK